MLFKVFNKFLPKTLSIILIFIKRKIYKNKQSKSILFIVEFPQSFSSFKSIINSFKKITDKQFIQIIILKNSNYNKVHKSNFENLLDYNQFNIINEDEIQSSYNYIFIHNPYDIERPNSLSFQKLYFKCNKIIYLSYGIEIAGGRKLTQFNMPSQRYSDYVFVHSESAKSQYKKYCSTGDNHVYALGHPSYDEIKFNSNDIENNYFLWCPHHSVSEENNDLSTFLIYDQKIYNYFKNNTSKTLCIRPHPMLRKKLNDMGNNYSQRLNKLLSLNNIYEDTTNDYTSTFEKSIALVSDASSFLMIYPLLKKPMLFLKNLKGPELGDDGVFFKDCTATGWDELKFFLDNGYLNKEYIINLDHEIINIGCAGREIVNFLKK